MLSLNHIFISSQFLLKDFIKKIWLATYPELDSTKPFTGEE